MNLQKKGLIPLPFLDRQGIKAGLFFAGHQSVLSNRVEALARIRAADSFVIVTKDLEESGLFAHAARCMEKQGLIIYEGALTRKLITCVTKMEINSFLQRNQCFPIQYMQIPRMTYFVLLLCAYMPCMAVEQYWKLLMKYEKCCVIRYGLHSKLFY